MSTAQKPSFRQGASPALTVLWSMLATLAILFPSLAFSADPDNAPCNLKSPWVNDASYSGLQSALGTGGLVCVNGSGNAANLIDTNLSNFASVNITGLGCSTTFRVNDNDAADTYPAGYFAGYKISSANLLSGGVAATVRIETWNDGAFVQGQDVVTNLVGIESSLIDGSGNATVGFVTTAAFDEVRIRYTTLVGALFTGQVYYPVIEKFCAEGPLSCNTQTQANNPVFPTIIDTANTGISGLACMGCSLNNSENVISQSTTDHATLTLAAAAGTVGAVAVKDVLTTYQAGTFTGFDISNPNLVAANALSGLTVKTYLNGVLQETAGAGTLVSAGSALLNGTGSQLVGFITTQPFNEVKLEVTNLLGVLNVTEIYDAVFEKLCTGPALSCGADTYLATTAYPAVIDAKLTGFEGAVCALCSLNDTQNVVDADTSNFASIVLVAGVLSEGSIAVKDALTTYPQGTFAGFDVDNLALISAAVLNSNVTIRTYLNGALQETNGGGTLLTLDLLSASRQIVGFTTTLPFNEVRFTVANNVVNADVGTTLVRGAVLRAASAAGTAAPVLSSPTASNLSQNACPLLTVNLNAEVTSSTPSGAELVWYDNPGHTGSPISNPAAVAVTGTYYAFYHDAAGGCFSQGAGLAATTYPCVQDDAASTPRNTPVGGNVAANDTYPADSTFSVTANPAHGVVSLDPATGAYTYTPTTGYTGVDSFQYQVCLPQPNTSVCSSATVNLTVVPPTPPSAVNDTASTPANTPASGNVASNDSFATGSAFSVVSNPAHGTLALNADGTYTYTPTNGYTGADSFQYKVCLPSPNSDLCSTATVNVTVGPLAVNDSASTAQNTPLNGDVSTNDVAPAGAVFTKTGEPAHGTVTVNTDGTYTYTPTTGYTGPDSFTYQVCTAGGPPCSTATVSITVTAANAPVAVNDTATTPAGSPVSGNVSSNDTFPVNSTFSVVTNPAHGTVSLNPDGSTYTYTPTAGYAGPDSFTYQICLPSPNEATCSAPATVSITVTPVAANDTATTPAGTPLNGNVSTNDTVPVNSVFTQSTGPSHGTVTVNPDGTYTYVPAPGYTGPDSFTYQVCAPGGSPCSTATVNITVTPATAVPPQANNDSATTPFGTTVVLPVLNNDAGGKAANGEATTLVLNTVDLDPATPAVQATKTIPGEGTWTANPDGTVTFVPATGFTGTTSAPYTVTDSTGTVSNTALMTVVVQAPVNPGTAVPPVANDDYASTLGTTPVTLSVLTNDTGGKTAGGATTTLAAAASTVDIDPSTPGAQNVLATEQGTWTVNANGTVTFTAAPGFSGIAITQYVANDSAGQTSNAATLHVTVGNGASLVAVDDSAQTPVNTQVVAGVLDNDLASSGATLDPSTVDLDPATAGIQGSNTVAGKGTFTANADGTVSFAPESGFTGTISTPYSVTDTAGQTGSASLTVLVTPTAATAIDDQATTPFNTPAILQPTSNDSASPPAVLNPSTVDLDPGLAGIQTHLTTADGTWSVTDVNGTVQFTPNATFSGATSIPYAVSDSLGNVAEATMTVAVGPDAMGDSLSVTENTPASGNVAGNDTFPANATFTVSTHPAHGTVSLDPATGAYTYTPAAGYTGPDSFQYQLCLPAPNSTVCSTATVAINVVAPTPPTAVNDTASTLKNTPVSGDVSTNDTFPPGSTFSVDTHPAHGTVTVNPNGTYTYTPTTDFIGTDSFIYQVCLPAPNASVCSIATVGVTVTATAAADLRLSMASSTPQPSVGLPFTYTLTLDNQGGPTSQPVSVTEHVPAGIKLIGVQTSVGWTCTPTVSASQPLQGGATLVCNYAGVFPAVGSETLTLTAVPTAVAGSLLDWATVVGDGDTPPTSPGASCDGSYAHNCGQVAVTPVNPAIQIIKRVSLTTDGNSDGKVQAGDVLTYTFTLSNRGDALLTPVTLYDPQIDVGSFSCQTQTAAGLPFSLSGGNNALAANDSVVCTATHTAQAAESSAGQLQNIGLATGTPPDGKPVQATGSATWDNTPPTHQIILAKTAIFHDDATTDGLFEAGETVSYGFIVRNVGATTVDSLAVSDPLFPAGAGYSINCPLTTLAPGQQTVCTLLLGGNPVDYSLTAGDVAAGHVTNTATATGTVGGTPVSATDTHVLNNGQPSGIKVDKTVAFANDTAPFGVVSAGDQLSYTLVATNTGATSLNKVTITDDRLGVALQANGACAPAQGSALAPGQSMVCTASYTVQANEPSPVANLAIASGQPVGQLQPVYAAKEHVVPGTTPTTPLYSLAGAQVWQDGNNNGIQDATEPGIDGVVVRLQKLVGGTWVQATYGDGSVVPDQVTAGGGFYQFANLPLNNAANPYRVQVLPVNFTTSSTGTYPLYNASSSKVDAANFATPGRDQGVGVTPSGTAGIVTKPVDFNTLPTGTTNLGTVSFGFVIKVTAIPPDVVLVKSASASTVARGGQLTYTLQASDAAGAGNVTSNVTVLDTLPTGMTAVLPVSATGWNCSASTAAKVICTYNGGLPVLGGSAIGSPINVLVNVGAGTATGPVVNTATVTKLTGERSFSNNTATASVTVQ